MKTKCLTKCPRSFKRVIFCFLFLSSFAVVYAQKHITANDSVPFRFLPWEEQIKLKPLAPFHEYEGKRLGLFSGEYTLKENGIKVATEMYPGVLVYNETKNRVGSTQWMVEFYDTATHRLISRLNLDETNPYTHKNYEKIVFGSFDGEGDQAPPDPDSSCKRGNLPNPDNYKTYTLVEVSPGGHVCVQHELYKIAGRLFVGYEQTLVVYDARGEELYSMCIAHSINSSYVSTDGRYLAFIYGGNALDFFDPCEGHLEVFDLTNKKNILSYTFDKDEHVDAMVEVEEDGWLYIGTYNIIEPSHTNKILLLSTKSRTYQVRSFTRTEWQSVVKNWISYKNLVKEYKFNTQKF